MDHLKVFFFEIKHRSDPKIWSFFFGYCLLATSKQASREKNGNNFESDLDDNYYLLFWLPILIFHRNIKRSLLKWSTIVEKCLKLVVNCVSYSFKFFKETSFIMLYVRVINRPSIFLFYKGFLLLYRYIILKICFLFSNQTFTELNSKTCLTQYQFWVFLKVWLMKQKNFKTLLFLFFNKEISFYNQQIWAA